MHLFVLPLMTWLAPYFADETISGYADPTATYALQEVNGTPATIRATITFPQEGKVAGSGPCNQYTAEQSAPYPWFELGPIAATRRACPDLAAESAYFALLPTMSLIEVSGTVLILSNPDGGMMVFRAQ